MFDLLQELGQRQVLRLAHQEMNMVLRAVDLQRRRFQRSGDAAKVAVQRGFNRCRDEIPPILGRENNVNENSRERLSHDVAY